MESNKLALDIKQISLDLLEKHDQPQEVKQLLDTVHAHFREATEMTLYTNQMQHLAAVKTASGMALSLNHAAECLIDYHRTAQFLRGIVTAIQQKQKDNPGETIHIFYAGCGPYAPFVTLVASLFKVDEVKFTLLEINRKSMDLAQKLIGSMNLGAYVDDYFISDAVTYQVQNPEKYHILFSETLDALLYRESYVPILMNMLPQFSEKTTLIPENVILKLSFAHPVNGEIEEEKGTVFNARKEVSAYMNEKSTSDEFPEVIFDLESHDLKRNLVLDTEVHVYKDIKLDRGASSLTLSYKMDIDPNKAYNRMVFAYTLKPQVQLNCDFE